LLLIPIAGRQEASEFTASSSRVAWGEEMAHTANSGGIMISIAAREKSKKKAELLRDPSFSADFYEYFLQNWQAQEVLDKLQSSGAKVEPFSIISSTVEIRRGC
jgi:hypothetical protein